MPALHESAQVGQMESWEEVIANADNGATPFTSLLPKVKKTSDNKVTSSQVKGYPAPSTQGVPDGVDAKDPSHNSRALIDSVIQKTWQQPAVSDLAQEMDVAGISDEMAEQIADAMVAVKRSIETVALSDQDCRDTETPTRGYETRGAFKWLDPSAQGTRPVPEDFRPAAAQQYTGTLANLTESAFKAMASSAFKERKGPAKMLGVVGIDLKEAFDAWLSYRTDVSGKLQIQTTNQDAKSKTYMECVDRIVLSSCEIDLMVSSFLLYSSSTTAEESASTHKSGLFVVKDMWSFDYMRAPRVVKLPYLGGGHKAIVDAIFMLRCLNPLGQFSAKIAS